MKILYFSAAWCGPCRTLAPIMESISDKIEYEKIDVDQNQDLSVKYNVRSIPTLVLVDDAGNELRRLTGAKQADTILNFYK
jgi:thioredoxin 1